MRKVALVTGGSRGIGKGIVKRFVQEGYFVYVTYNKSLDSVKELVTELGEDNVYPFQLMATDDEKVMDLINIINKQYGYLDVFVNNAGITKDNHFIMMKKNEWNDVIDTNLNSVFAITKMVSKIMMQNKKGSIVLVSSISAMIGQAGQSNYSASKAGLIALSRSIAKELAKFNIRVNCVSPGFITTDMTKKIPKKILSTYLEQIPLKREGTAEEVANAVYFLSSDEASYITGSNLVIDGGLV